MFPWATIKYPQRHLDAHSGEIIARLLEALDSPLSGHRGRFFMTSPFSMNMKTELKTNPNLAKLGDMYSQIVQIAARNVETDAKKRMADWPAVDTGDTMNSIEAREVAKDIWRIGPTTDYAEFVEYGTVYMTARPYMIPALEKENPRLMDALGKAVEKLD